jgi:hypothetical protein
MDVRIRIKVGEAEIEYEGEASALQEEVPAFMDRMRGFVEALERLGGGPHDHGDEPV